MSSLKKSLDLELTKLKELGRIPEFFTSEVHKPGTVSALGKTLTDFTNWDVLNLRSERSINRAFIKAAEEIGLGPAAARASSGTTKYHTACEERLAQFFGAESALLFSSRSQAVLSLIAALASERDLILHEEQSTCPAVDAAFLVNAEARSFKASADKPSLKFANTEAFTNVFAVLDSVSLVSGAMITPEFIISAAKQAKAELIVDESLAAGALGLRGAGVFEEFNTSSGLLCKISDLSRIINSSCACICGSKTLIDYLKTRSRTFKFETSPPASIAAAVEASVDAVELKHAAREKLMTLGLALHAGITELGLKTTLISAPHIVSIELDGISQCLDFRSALIKRGFLADALPPGKILSDTGIVRFVLQTAHSDLEINKLLEAISIIINRAN